MDPISNDRLKVYAPLVLRMGIALVFIWFGFSQISNPSDWVGYIPEFVSNMFESIFGLNSVILVLLNGSFEIILGIVLLLGYFIRTCALLLALHLGGIAYTVGINPMGVRDIGLTIATFAVFLQGKD